MTAGLQATTEPSVARGSAPSPIFAGVSSPFFPSSLSHAHASRPPFYEMLTHHHHLCPQLTVTFLGPLPLSCPIVSWLRGNLTSLPHPLLPSGGHFLPTAVRGSKCKPLIRLLAEHLASPGSGGWEARWLGAWTRSPRPGGREPTALRGCFVTLFLLCLICNW